MRKHIALIIALLCSLSLSACEKDLAGDAPVAGGASAGNPDKINADATETTQSEQEEDTKWAKIPMIMVKGRLYYDTGKVSDATERSDAMDGEITSAVDGTETPAEDDQSNFGSGYGYQYAENDTIVVYTDEQWRIFEYRSGDGSKVRFQDNWYSIGDLSEETLEWLGWYNGLSAEEQLAVDSIPSDILALRGAGDAKATDAPAPN